MKLPIIVYEKSGTDVYIYDSFIELQRDLEVADVKKHAYEAFDATGRSVRLIAADFERIDVELSEVKPGDADLLKLLIIRYLEKGEISNINLIDRQLSDLISQAKYQMRTML